MSAVDMLLRRLRVLIDRTVLHRVRYVDSVRVLQVSSRADSPLPDAEHIEPYGFTSHPLEGSEAIVANLGGNSGRAIVLLVNDRRHRIVIAESETAIYTANGEFIHLKADHSIHIKAASKMYLETPLVEMSQDLLVHGNAHIVGDTQIDGNETVAGTSHSTGSISTDGDVTGSGTSLHTHHHNGVQTGSGSTGGPV